MWDSGSVSARRAAVWLTSREYARRTFARRAAGPRLLMTSLDALPLRPPLQPMLARLERTLPVGEGWLYEPKWDGFRCLAFRSGADVALTSRHGRRLERYFPDVVAALRRVRSRSFVLDGELLARRDGRLAF